MMKTKCKIYNATLFLCTMLLSVLFFSLQVKAESVNEAEPNNDKENAQTIQANNETYAGAMNGTYTGQYVVHGYTSTDDPDWFKVYLKAGTNYITCNGFSFSYYIEDENGTDIFKNEYSEGGFGPKAYAFSVPTDGAYYVRITGIVSSSESYLFLIGSPTYTIGTCNINCAGETIEMLSTGENVIGIFDGNSVTNLPREAIATSVRIRDVRSSDVAGITLTNATRHVSFNLSPYNFKKDDIGSLNLPVNAIWEAEFKYNKATSFTPVLKITYVYPVYTTMVQ